MSISRLMQQITVVVAVLLTVLLTMAYADANVSARDDLAPDSTFDNDRCVETESWAVHVIPRLHSEGKLDSLNHVLDLWTDDCGESEPSVRTRILTAIETGTFDEGMYDSNIIDYLSMFRVSRENRYRNQSRFMGALFGDDRGVALAMSFDSTLVAIAEKLAGSTDSDAVEHLFCRYYSGDFDYFFRRLKSSEFDHTKLHQYYTNHIDGLKSSDDGFNIQYSARIGRWYPDKSMDVLGSHPEFGLSVGVMRKQIEIGLTGAVRWGDPNDNYRVFHKGRVRDTDHYFGGSIGIDIGAEILKGRIAGFVIFIGIGYDGIIAIEGDDNEKGKTLGSMSLGAGAHLRFFIDRYSSKYVGLLTRIGYVDYRNERGTQLTDGTFSIALTFGFCGRSEKIRKLKLLDSD